MTPARGLQFTVFRIPGFAGMAVEMLGTRSTSRKQKGLVGMHHPLDSLVHCEICVIQLFGRNRLECIAPGCVITVQGTSAYTRMAEIVWREKRYLAFERDLDERTQPVTVNIGPGEFVHGADAGSRLENRVRRTD